MMTERKPHPDNALIDRLEEEGAAAEGGRAGHNVNVDVGTRSELRNTATNDLGSEDATAKDHPQAMNEAKGDKAIGRLAPDNNG
jgi:hypothetical protein